MRNRYTDKFIASRFDAPLRSEMPQLPFDVQKLLDELRETLFPEITSRPLVAFGELDSLAFIVMNPKDHSVPIISIHSLLNHPQTPVEVIRAILIHELIHIIRPPRQIKKKLKTHPPEFWEKEKELSPNAQDAWDWIFYHFLHVLKREKRKERVRVKSLRGKRSLYTDPRASLATAVEAWSSIRLFEKELADGPLI